MPRIAKIKSFLDQYNRKERNFPTGLKYRNKFQTNNKAVTLNVLFLPSSSDGLENYENQVIVVMVTDGEKWHYLAVKSLPQLLHGITSKHNDYHYSGLELM